MTEAEWNACTEAYQPLIYVRSIVSTRKIKLVAAAFAYWLQSLPRYADTRHCAHLIERVADTPQTWAELEPEIWGLPGTGWAICHLLNENGEQTAKALAKIIALDLGEVGFGPEVSPSSKIPHHGMMLALLSEVIGNPFRSVVVDPVWLAWNNGAVAKLAEAIYTDRAFDRLPILADALEDAGCHNPEILTHCRGPGPHVRGCWVVDLLLGKT